MHALNGNKKIYFSYSDYVFQNLPGNKNVQDVQIALDILLAPSPAILAIGETSYEKLELCHFPGYQLLRGNQNNSTRMRLNLLVKDGLEYQRLHMVNELPTCALRLLPEICPFLPQSFFYLQSLFNESNINVPVRVHNQNLK